uniref:CONSTANS-like 2 n=1 Tax=Erycina pusilla TaxID=154679 RepID=M9QTN8_9ASPA|nr:CONSTANS-like 2 [Erycina pusilla]
MYSKSPILQKTGGAILVNLMGSTNSFHVSTKVDPTIQTPFIYHAIPPQSSLISLSTSTTMFNSPYSSSTSPTSYNPDDIFGAFFDAGGGIGGGVQPMSSLLSSSVPSYFLNRSSSSHSLPLPSLPTDPRDFQGFNNEPVRRVFSAGDLQCINNSISSSDSSGRIGRYSTEERKERIERYRTKRNQRNFHKKITYACRKTLADSRPRVRGRFARNGDTEHETESMENCFENGNNGENWWRNDEDIWGFDSVLDDFSSQLF